MRVTHILNSREINYLPQIICLVISKILFYFYCKMQYFTNCRTSMNKHNNFFVHALKLKGKYAIIKITKKNTGYILGLGHFGRGHLGRGH